MQENSAEVIEIGNTKDHMHVLLSISPNTEIAKLMKQIKGATSYMVNHNTDRNLYWQDGYGVVSVSKSGLKNVKEYVSNQKNHHQENKLIEVLEKVENSP